MYSYPLVNVGLGIVVRDISSSDNVRVNVGERVKVFRGSVVIKVVRQCAVGDGEVRVKETVQVSRTKKSRYLSSHPEGQSIE